MWAIESDDAVAAEMWCSVERLPTRPRVQFVGMSMLRFREGLGVTEHECFDLKEAEPQLADGAPT